jgi:AhpD family alkylhydroperoxidase
MTHEEERITAYNESRAQSHAWFEGKSPAYRAFLDLEKQAFRKGALDRKTKELMALAISVVIKCEPCMEYHVREALEHGATEEEIVEALEVTFEMGGGPATVQARFALAALEHWRKK